jgi:hypothetical protein
MRFAETAGGALPGARAKHGQFIKVVAVLWCQCDNLKAARNTCSQKVQNALPPGPDYLLNRL